MRELIIRVMDNPQQPVEQHLAPPSSSKSQLIPLIAVGIIMLLVGLGAGYLLFANKNSDTSKISITTQLSPTPDISPTIETDSTLNETPNWKTYNSQKYLLTLRYPQDLDYNEDENSQSISFFPAGKKENEVAQREIHIFVTENPSKLSANNYWKTQIQTNGRLNKPTTKINLGDLDAIQVESFGLDHKRLSTVIVATKDLIYEIDFNEYIQPISTYAKSIPDNIFTEMLNSFEVSNQ